MSRTLGIDLGPTAVRGVLVRSSFRAREVLRYVEIRTAPEGPVPARPPSPDGGAADAAAAGARMPRLDALSELLSLVGGSADSAVVAVDGRLGSLRPVELPPTARKRTQAVLPYELEALLPFSLDDTVIDHQELAPPDTQVHLLAAAVPKEHVRTLLADLRQAGVEPREIAFGAAALDGLVAALDELEGGGPRAIVDVRGEVTDLCVLDDGRCTFARTLSVGSASPALAHELGLAHTHYRTAAGRPWSIVHLVGEAEPLAQLAADLERALGVETRVLGLPPTGEEDPTERAPYARALALAARGQRKGRRIDLRQGEFAPRRSVSALRQHAKVLLACAVAVFLSFAFSVYARWSSLADSLDGLRTELDAACQASFRKPCPTLEGARDLLRGAGAAADPLPKYDALDALDAVAAGIPDDVHHETKRLHVQLDDDLRGGRLELQGLVESAEHYDQIYAQLEGHECFHELKRGQTNQVGGKTNYRLEAAIRCPTSGGTPAGEGARHATR